MTIKTAASDVELVASRGRLLSRPFEVETPKNVKLRILKGFCDFNISRSLLSKLLLLLLCVRQCAAITYVLSVQGTSTDAVLKATNHPVYINSQSLVNFYVYACSNKLTASPDYQIRAYNELGAGVLGNIGQPRVGVSGMGFTGPLLFSILGLNADFDTYSIQVNAGPTVVFTKELAKSLTVTHNLAVNNVLGKQGTNYVFTSGGSSVYRFDQTNPGTSTLLKTTGTLVAASSTSATIQDNLWIDGTYILVFCTEQVFFVNSVGMTSPQGTSNSNKNFDKAVMESSTSTTLYYTYQDTDVLNVLTTLNQYIIVKATVNGAGASYTNTILGNWYSSQITNLASLPFQSLVVYTLASDSKIYLADYSLNVLASLAGLVNTAMSLTLMLGYADATGTYFLMGLTDSVNYKFVSANIAISRCTSGTNPCTACTTGYYLNSAATGNQCILPNSMPGYGPSGAYFAPCLGSTTSGCTACSVVYSTCTQCNTAGGYYLYTSGATTVCYTVPTMPNSIGRNVAGNIATACGMSNCLTCAADTTVCNTCNTNYYPKSNSPNTCNSNAFTGYGLTAVTRVITPCTDTSCSTCTDPNTACTFCYAPKLLYNSVCTAQFSGYGTNSGSPAYAIACSVANCGDCWTTSTTCVACSSGYYFLQGSTSSCNQNNIPGKGLVPVTQVLAACTVSNCALCYAAYTACTACAAGFYFKSDSPNTCNANTFTGYGLSTSNVITPCTDSYCGTCTAVNSVCTLCTAPRLLYNSVCTAQFSGYGKNLASPAFAIACTVANCGDCWASSGTCVSCKTGYYFLQGSTTSCNQNTIPGKGLVTSTQVLTPCANTNCGLCYADYTMCTQCVSTYYLKEGQVANANPACFLNTISGMGIKSSTLIATCLVSSCLECRPNYSQCTQCASGYLMVQGAGSGCLTLPAPGYLEVISTPNYLVTCPTHCQTCTSTTVCTECFPSWLLQPSSASCVLDDQPRFGPTLVVGILTQAACSDPHCVQCFSNIDTCANCQPGWVVSGTVCTQRTEYLTVVSTSYIKDMSLEFTITFSQVLATLTDFSNLVYTLWLQDGSVANPSRYSVSFVSGPSADSVTGKIVMADKSSLPDSLKIIYVNESPPVFYSSTLLYDSKLPITITRSPRDQLASFGQAQMPVKVVAYTLFTAASLSIGSSGTGGTDLSVMIKIIDSVEFYLYLDGERVYMADKFLNLFTNSLLAIAPNYFRVDEAQIRCNPGLRFEAESVSCYFLNNFGSELTTLAILFISAVLVTILCKWIRKLKKQNLENKAVAVMAFLIEGIGKVISLSFFMSLVDGSQIEVFRDCFLNLKNRQLGRVTTVGLAVSTIVLSLYCFLGVLYIIYPFKNGVFKKKVSFNKIGYSKGSTEETKPKGILNSKQHPFSNTKILLTVPEDLDSNPESQSTQKNKVKSLSFLKEVFDEFKPPSSEGGNLHFLMPAIGLGHSAVVQFLLVWLSNKGMVQLYAILLAYVAYLIVCLFLRPYKKQYRNVLLILILLGSCIINVLYILANNPLEVRAVRKEKREAVYGWALIAVFLAIIIMGLVPAVGNLVNSTLALFSGCKKKQKNSPITSTESDPQVKKLRRRREIISEGSPKATTAGNNQVKFTSTEMRLSTQEVKLKSSPLVLKRGGKNWLIIRNRRPMKKDVLNQNFLSPMASPKKEEYPVQPLEEELKIRNSKFPISKSKRLSLNSIPNLGKMDPKLTKEGFADPSLHHIVSSPRMSRSHRMGSRWSKRSSVILTVKKAQVMLIEPSVQTRTSNSPVPRHSYFVSSPVDSHASHPQPLNKIIHRH